MNEVLKADVVTNKEEKKNRINLLSVSEIFNIFFLQLTSLPTKSWAKTKHKHKPNVVAKLFRFREKIK
jgi:hypothetical protein